MFIKALTGVVYFKKRELERLNSKVVARVFIADEDLLSYS